MNPTQTSLGTSRYKSDKLRTQHRDRLAAFVRGVRAKGVKFNPSQDYRTAKNYAGIEYTCDAYLDRLEATA